MKCFRRIVRAIKKPFTPKIVLVKIDGGICSQIHQYLLGRYFAEKGMLVKHNLLWFKKCGKGLDGRFVMNFDLLKMFRNLEFLEASKKEIKKLRSFKCHVKYFHSTEWKNNEPPLNLSEYYSFSNEEYSALFHKYFSRDFSVLDEPSSKILAKINAKENSCAIHCRRGDLSNGLAVFYGDPTTVDYYLKAIEYVVSNVKNPHFFFFSDEVDWIEANIVPRLGKNISFEIVGANGTDKGYMDLLLISACHHQVASIGSFGKFGALLNPKNDKIFITHSVEAKEQVGTGVLLESV